MVLPIAAIVMLTLSLIFSIQYRMTRHPILRKMGQGLMNVCMGLTLMLFSLQLAASEVTTLRLIVSLLLFLLGLFNFIMGVKHYLNYKSQLKQG
jgi:hypothetical protein